MSIMSDDTETFAEVLKSWRARAGLTQKEAAEYLHVPHRTLEAWEHGKQAPDQEGPIRKLIERDKRGRKA